MYGVSGTRQGKVSGVSRGKISAQAHHIKLMYASTSLAHSILCEIIRDCRMNKCMGQRTNLTTTFLTLVLTGCIIKSGFIIASVN